MRGRLVACGRHVYRAADPPAPVDREKALRELGRRYLAAHAPAGPEDLARWAGIGLRDARAALRDAAVPEPDTRPLPPRLLGGFHADVARFLDSDNPSQSTTRRGQG